MKMWYTCRLELYSAIKKTKFQFFQENKSNWKCYVTENKSRAQKDKQGTVSLLCRAQLGKVVGADSECVTWETGKGAQEGERLQGRQEGRETAHVL